ncbi:hypothetical protein HY212_04595 [Candidatus Pacearchaeota archaeon]|nr:hypothetical protein [Candidatus Pacearchaeota archaeon]
MKLTIDIHKGEKFFIARVPELGVTTSLPMESNYIAVTELSYPKYLDGIPERTAAHTTPHDKIPFENLKSSDQKRMTQEYQ